MCLYFSAFAAILLRFSGIRGGRKGFVELQNGRDAHAFIAVDI